LSKRLGMIPRMSSTKMNISRATGPSASFNARSARSFTSATPARRTTNKPSSSTDDKQAADAPTDIHSHPIVGAFPEMPPTPRNPGPVPPAESEPTPRPNPSAPGADRCRPRAFCLEPRPWPRCQSRRHPAVHWAGARRTRRRPFQSSFAHSESTQFGNRRQPRFLICRRPPSASAPKARSPASPCRS
jgi:hypothetical protein